MDDRPPRVAFVMEQVLGHTTWSLNLRSALDRMNTEAVWIETSLFSSGGLPERFPGLPPVARAGWRAALDVRRGLRGQRYDVLLFNTQKAAMLCQPYLLRRPTLLMTDVTPAQYDRMGGPYEHSATSSVTIARAKHAVNVLNFRLARGLIPWSHWTAASLISEYRASPERVHVVPPGVDTTLWQAPGRRVGAVPRLLFVGGDFARKGGRLLLDAFRAIGLDGRAALDVVTRHPVPPMPGVTVHHGLANGSAALRDLYAQADAFVLPTLGDCFSIASIEAMAMGLPVVTTDVGGIADIVIDRTTGLLIPAGDGRALRQALDALIGDIALRSRLGSAGRQRAVASFDSVVSAKRLLAIAAEVRAPAPTHRRPHVVSI